MAEENPNGGGEGGTPQDPKPQGEPQDPKAGEGTKPQDPGQGEGTDVNLHKLERDVANRDKRIKELEQQPASAQGGTKTIEERMAEVERELAASKKALADERVAGSLKALGCVNVKAARCSTTSAPTCAGMITPSAAYIT